jgi:nucleoside-diphosphate-sugar epimerase
MNTKIGITGGSGLIGKILIKILKKKKIKFTCYKKDIRDDKSIKEWLLKNKDIDKICHLAAIVPTNLVNKNRNKSIAVNLKGTIALYNAVKSLNKNIWFFFASTSHIYKSKNTPLKENDKIKPTSFYGETKLMAENFLQKENNKKIKICIGRIFSIFHNNQKKPFFYPSMVSKFKNKKNIYNKVFILKGGLSVRDFSSADDVANIIIKLSKKKAKGVINIGSGVKITLLDFIKKYINNDIKIKSIGKRNTLTANISKLKKLSILK